jgi:pyruvate formate lyase activating enzyme
MQPMDESSQSQVCKLCATHSSLIATQLGVCADCIRSRPEEALEITDGAHSEARWLFGLPGSAPRSEGGRRCGLCAQDCVIGEGERGYCGLREVRGGRLRHLAGTPGRGLLHWYRDPLPTNCVAEPFCPGHLQFGKHNLAVSYSACTVDCLSCQNWHFREQDVVGERTISAAELATVAGPRTYCVCYFGGDPASQMPHALAVSRLLTKQGLAICWETNGTAHPRFMDRAVAYSLASGGCVKFDLKAYDSTLHRALTGIGNARTLENFARAAARFGERDDPPLLVASTLLVPGYVDAEEVGRIATFVAELNPAIPYVLLGFAPQFLFPDLPTTSVRHAEEAEAAAQSAGLQTVHVGNRHLLSRDY